MGNYLETLVEKMVADGVSEQDIKSVIEELGSKESPLHQVTTSPTSSQGGDQGGITSGNTSQGGNVSSGGSGSNGTTSSSGTNTSSEKESEAQCPKGHYWDEAREVCLRKTPEVSDKVDLGKTDTSYMDESFEQSQSEINDILSNVPIPVEGVPEEEPTEEHIEQSKIIYDNLEMQSSVEREAFKDYLDQQNITYNEGRGFETNDTEYAGMLPEIDVDTKSEVGELETIQGIYNSIGGEDPQVFEQLESIQSKADEITEESPSVQDSMWDDYFNTDSVNRPEEKVPEITKLISGGDTPKYYKNSLDEDLLAEWGEEKYNLYKSYEDGDIPTLQSVFPQSDIDGYVRNEKARIVQNGMKEAQELFFKDGFTIFDLSSKDSSIQDDFSIMLAVHSSIKEMPGDVSYSLEWLLEAYRSGEKAAEVIYSYYQNRYIDNLTDLIKNYKDYRIQEDLNPESDQEILNQKLRELGSEAIANKSFEIEFEGKEYFVLDANVEAEQVVIVIPKSDKRLARVFETVLESQLQKRFSTEPFEHPKTKKTYYPFVHYVSDAVKLSREEEAVIRKSLKSQGLSKGQIRDEIFAINKSRTSGKIAKTKLGKEISSRTVEVMAIAIVEHTANTKILENLVEEYEKTFADITVEAAEIVKAISDIYTDPNSTVVDLSYAAGLFERLDEINPEYQAANIAWKRVLNQARLVQEQAEDISENWEMWSKDEVFYDAFSMNYNKWKKGLAGIKSLFLDIKASWNALTGGKDYVNESAEYKAYMAEEFPMSAKWSDDVSWWMWWSDAMANNTGNMLALATAFIPVVGTWVSTSVFVTWTTGGEYTNKVTQKKAAAEYKKVLEEALLDPTLTEVQREYFEEEMLLADETLSYSDENNRGMSWVHGIITGITERFGSIRLLKGWSKLPSTKRLPLIQRIYKLKTHKYKNLAIEVFEEYLDQGFKNVSEKLNGRTVNVTDGMDMDFFTNVVAFSHLIQSSQATMPLYNAIREAVLTTKEREQIADLTDQLDAVDAEIEFTKRNPNIENGKDGHVKRVQDLKKKRNKIISDLTAVDIAIVDKLGYLKNTVVDGKITETRGEKIKRIFALAKKRDQYVADALSLQGIDANSRKKQQELEDDYKETQREIDELLKIEGFDVGNRTPKQAINLARYMASLEIAKNSAKPGLFRVIKGERLTEKQEAQIRKSMKQRGFSDEIIDHEIQGIKEDLTTNKSARFCSTGDFISYQNTVIKTITGVYRNEDGNVTPMHSDMDIYDATVSPLHEIFHQQHVDMGLIDENGLIKKEFRKTIAELESFMETKYKNGKITKEVYDHFVERLSAYDEIQTEAKTEELLNIIGDIMNWGGIEAKSFNQLYAVKRMLNALVTKLLPGYDLKFSLFNDTEQVYRYISKFHTDSNSGFINLSSDQDPSELAKHSLNSGEIAELKELKEKRKEINQKFIKDLSELKTKLGVTDLITEEHKKLREPIDSKKNKDLSDVNARIVELEGGGSTQNISLEARSKMVQDIYESEDLSDNEKETRILKLMQPYLTTISKVWDFGIARTNKEQAYEFGDFRRDLEYWIVKHVQQYDPNFDQTLSSYIMHNTKLKIPGLLENNLVDNPVSIDDIDIVDDTSGGSLEVISSVDQEINSKLRKAFGIEKGSPEYQNALNSTLKIVLKNISGSDKILENVDKIERLYNELESTDNKKRRKQIRSEISSLESQNNALLDNILDTSDKKKEFRKELKKAFIGEFLVVIKNAVGKKKSIEFRKFLKDNKRLIIDLIAVKYKNLFPTLSTDGGRMDTDKSVKSQTSMDGSFVESTSAGNTIWIKNYDISDEAFIALFTDNTDKNAGRTSDNKYKKLVESLSNELGLDAVFEVLPNQLESIVGKIVETIKRDPLVKFSLGPKVIAALEILSNKDKAEALQGLVRELEIIQGYIEESSYEDVVIDDKEYYEGEFTDLARAIIESINEDINIENSEDIKFKADLKKITKELGIDITPYTEDGVLVNNENKDINGKGALDRQFEGTKAFLLDLGWEMYNLFGKKMFNFTRRGMNDSDKVIGPSRTDGKKFSKSNQSGGANMNNSTGTSSYLVEGWTFNPSTGLFEMNIDKTITSKDPVGDPDIKAKRIVGEFYERRVALENQLKKENKPLPDGIENLDFNSNYNSAFGLMDQIYKKVLSSNDYYGDKMEIQEQKLEAIEELFGDKIRAANANNIKKAKFLAKKLKLAVQNGLISEAVALHFLQSQTNIDTGFRALTSLDFVTIEGIEAMFEKLKGEHIIPNGNTMLELAMFILSDDNTNIDEKLDEIFQGHSQFLGPKELFDVMDDVLGQNSDLGFDRIKALTQKSIKEAYDKGIINKEQYDRHKKTLERYEGTTFSIDGLTFMEKRAQLEAIAVNNAIRKSIIQKNSLGPAPYNGGTVLDFDLTVGESDNVVIATSPDGKTTRELDGKKWAEDGDDLLSEGWTMDFSDFDNVTNGKEGPVFPYLIKQLIKFGPENVHILTARASGSQKNILQFLNDRIDAYNRKNNTTVPHLKSENIKGLGNSTGKAKADWIETNLVFNGVNDIVFIDDHLPNVEAVQDMFNLYPDGFFKDGGKSIITKFSLGPKFNSILERVKGIRANKVFSEAQAKLRGMKKGRFQFIIKPSANDFAGLIQAFLGKGEQGNADLKFFQDNLIKPFNKGSIKIDQLKQKLKNDFKDLTLQFPGVKKLLKKEVLRADGSKSGFTNEQAIRAYLHIANGHGDELGLSDRDYKLLLKTVNDSVLMKTYADKLNVITDGYIKPDASWISGNMSADMFMISILTGREEALEDFIKNKNEIFSVDNLRKIEAAYGSDFREALEDMLYKMEHGKVKGASKIRKMEKAWLTWVSGSTGAVMFFNTRSALLQLLSSTNYIELTGPNNMANVVKAMANVKQFWGDVKYILQSDFMKQRRGGKSIDINMVDLNRILVSSGDSVLEQIKAGTAYLLEIGFTPTQAADALAIALGGAAFYRNYTNFYMKTGMSKEAAEKKAWELFVDKTLETQQSTRADKLSYEQSSMLGKFLLNFKVTPMQYTRKMVKSLEDLVNGRGSVLENLSTIVYYGGLQNLAFSAMQNLLIAGLWEEDEEWEKRSDKVIKSMVDNILYGFGLEGVVIVTVKNGILEYFKQEKKGWNADHTYTILQFVNASPVIGSKLRKIYQSIQTKKFGEDAIGGMDWYDAQNPAWSALFSLIEGFTNIPTARIHRKIKNIVIATSESDVIVVKNEDGSWDLEETGVPPANKEAFEIAVWQRMMLLLGWSPWDVGLETIDKIIKNEVKKEKTKEKEVVKKKEKKEEVEEEIKEDIKEEKQKKSDINTCSSVNSKNKRCKNKVDKAGQKCAAHGGGGKKCSFIKPNNKQCKLLAVDDNGRCNTKQHKKGYKK